MSRVVDRANWPSIIYKYRDWNNCFHRDLIEKQELYFASPRKFNDPYDCRFTITYNPDDIAHLANTFMDIKPGLRDDEYIMEAHKKSIEIKGRSEQHIKKLQDEFIEGVERDFGVVSYSKHPDQILMWSHYSNSHQGFCVGFDTEKMFELYYDEQKFGIWGNVQYPPEYPVIHITETDEEKSVKLLFTKYPGWGYEDEFRTTKMLFANQKLILNKEIFKEVIIGELISEDDEANIRLSIRKHLPMIKVFKIRRDRTQYKLHLDPIKIV